MTGFALAHLFEHNTWANLRLIEACAALSDAQLDASPGATSNWSARRALTHLVSCQQDYLSLLTLPPDERRDTEPAFDDLPAAARTSGDGLLALAVAEASRGEPARAPIRTADGYRVESWVVMLQVINHATDHRRQVCDLLRAQGLTPPRLDSWAFGEHTGALTKEAS